MSVSLTLAGSEDPRLRRVPFAEERLPRRSAADSILGDHSVLVLACDV